MMCYIMDNNSELLLILVFQIIRHFIYIHFHKHQQDVQRYLVNRRYVQWRVMYLIQYGNWNTLIQKLDLKWRDNQLK